MNCMNPIRFKITNSNFSADKKKKKGKRYFPLKMLSTILKQRFPNFLFVVLLVS